MNLSKVAVKIFTFIQYIYKINTVRLNLERKKECDVWPSMVPHPRNLCSASKPSIWTHTAVRSEQTHTHCEHIPGAVGSHLYCGARGAVGGSVPCSRAPQSWY